jgi:hypothetical protein
MFRQACLKAWEKAPFTILVVASVAITNGLMHDWAARPMLRAWLGLRSQGRLRLPLKAFSEAKMSNDPAKLAAR